MKKTNIFLTAALLAMSGNAFADEFLLEDFSIEPGETKTVSFVLNNPDMNYIAFEFFMTLPEGIKIVEDEDGFLEAELNSARSSRHSLEAEMGSDGAYHFLCYSSSNRAFKGTEGDLLSINVTADESLEDAVLVGNVFSLKFSDPEENPVVFDDFSFNITVGNPAAEVSIFISDTGMGTFCSPIDLDFSEVTDFKAYIATGYNKNSGNVIVQAVSDAPRGTGLFLKGTPGTYSVPAGTSGSYFVNMLVGTTTETTISPTEGNYTNFILYNGNNGVGFYPLGGNHTMGANKAYLQIPTSMVGTSAGANYVGIEFDEGVTGIDSTPPTIATDATWFTVDGRKLNGKPAQKGVYVVEGKKVVIK